MPLELTSPTFANGGAIPRNYTCDGQDISPMLQWSDPPPGVQSFALTLKAMQGHILAQAELMGTYGRQ